MWTTKSDSTTSELLKSSMAPLVFSCSHRMAEMAEKPHDFSLNYPAEAIQEEVDWL